MDVVAKVVGPNPAGMLVKAHGPEGCDLDFRIGIKFGQSFEALLGNAGHFMDLIKGVFRDEFGELVKCHVGRATGIRCILGRLFARIFGAQAITDIDVAAAEDRVFVDKIGIDPVGLDDVIGDIVQDRQIGLRLEHHRDIGKVKTAMFIC